MNECKEHTGIGKMGMISKAVKLLCAHVDNGRVEEGTTGLRNLSWVGTAHRKSRYFVSLGLRDSKSF